MELLIEIPDQYIQNEHTNSILIKIQPKGQGQEIYINGKNIIRIHKNG